MSTDTATSTVEFATSPDGTRIAFERSGSGPLLVLVDGALCSREQGPGRGVAAKLADRYTVVVYDRRGRGDSGDVQPYAPEREFEDLAAVIEAAGGRTGDAAAFVAGQSSGAGIAYRAAAAGVPMRKLVGYEAPWIGVNAAKDGTSRDYLADLRALLAAGETGKAVGYFLVTMVQAPAFVPLMLRLMPATWRRMRALASTLPYDALVMGGDFEVPTAELSTIAVPTLVACGGKSPARMSAAQHAVAAAIPGAERRTVPGQTHAISAAAFAGVVADFFSA